MQWAEWEDGVLSAGTDLVATTSAAPFYGGTVLSAMPNPLRAYAFNSAVSGSSASYVSTKLPIMDTDPYANGYSMSPGTVAFYPDEKFNGVDNETHFATQDFVQLKASYDTYTA